MGSQNRVGYGRRKRWIDRLRCRDNIERLLLVEPCHFNRPFDGSTRAVDFEGAVGIARDGDNAPVEFGGIAGVDLQFFLAGTSALLQRRIVEKRQAHSPLDLQCPIGPEKNHRSMGIDPLAAAGRTEAGAIEEIEHLLLQVSLGCGRVHGRSNCHGSSTAAPVICPARNFERTSFASCNGNALVCVLMPACAATLKNAIPSLRVRLATESSCRSSQRMW